MYVSFIVYHNTGAISNPVVKLSGDKSWLPLHDFSFGCPCSWEPIYILRFRIEFIDQNNWANVFFFHLFGECYFLIHFDELYQDLTSLNVFFYIIMCLDVLANTNRLSCHSFNRLRYSQLSIYTLTFL